MHTAAIAAGNAVSMQKRPRRSVLAVLMQMPMLASWPLTDISLAVYLSAT